MCYEMQRVTRILSNCNVPKEFDQSNCNVANLLECICSWLLGLVLSPLLILVDVVAQYLLNSKVGAAVMYQLVGSAIQ